MFHNVYRGLEMFRIKGRWDGYPIQGCSLGSREHKVCEYFESVDLIKRSLEFTYSKFTPEFVFTELTEHGIKRFHVKVHTNNEEKEIHEFAIQEVFPKNQPDHL